MASAFLTRVSAILKAIQEGVAAATPEIDIDTSQSNAVQSATYNVVSQELSVQFRNRRRKTYFYPMNPVRANEFDNAASKGTWLRGRAFTTRGRNPATGRFGKNPRANG